MEVLYAVCCGLDVHQATVTACLRSPGDGPQRRLWVLKTACSVSSSMFSALGRRLREP